MQTITDLIKKFELDVKQYSLGYKNLNRYANQLSEEIRLVKKDIAAHSRAGLTTRYVQQYMKSLSEEATGARQRSLNLRRLRNEAFISLYELKVLMTKAGL